MVSSLLSKNGNQQLASVRWFYCLDKQKVSFVSRSTNIFHKVPILETCCLHTLFIEDEAETSGKKYRAMFID